MVLRPEKLQESRVSLSAPSLGNDVSRNQRETVASINMESCTWGRYPKEFSFIGIVHGAKLLHKGICLFIVLVFGFGHEGTLPLASVPCISSFS